jgi:hypothetical protein
MEVSKALGIVRALADGTDPYTGEVYPAESPYQNAETVRALFTAIDAVEEADRRRKRKRSLPERAGKPWDDEEDSVLIKRFEEDVSVKKIAVEHRRTEGAIRSRLEKLGKITRE